MSVRNAGFALVGFISLILFSQNSFARYSTPQEKGYEYLLVEKKIHFNKDGTNQSDTKYIIKILSQKGIDKFGKYDITYSPKSERITDIHATVQSESNSYEVGHDKIEDQQLSQEYNAFDEDRTKIIMLPHLQVGSELHISYRIEELQAAIPGVLSARLFMPKASRVLDYHLQVTMPASTAFYIHDPSKYIEGDYQVQTDPVNKITTITVRTSNLPIDSIRDETDSVFSATDSVWLDLTNQPSFEAAALQEYQGYKKIIAEPLPSFYQKLFGVRPEQPLNEQSAQERLQETLLAVRRKMRYFREWRRVDGGFVPRHLNEVAESGYGDCKDFATMVVKLAEYLGLKGQIVLLHSSNDTYNIKTIPTLMTFNHAIARVQIPGKNEYWYIDATAELPLVGRVSASNADRYALVLGENGGAVHIPPTDPSKTFQEVHFQNTLKGEHHLQRKFSIFSTGIIARYILRTFQYASDEMIQEELLDYAGLGPNEVIDLKLIDHTESFKDGFATRGSIAFEEVYAVVRSGRLRVIRPNFFGGYIYNVKSLKTEDRVSDFGNYALRTLNTKQEFFGITKERVKGLPAGCDLKTPWFEYKREYVFDDHLKINDQTVILKPVITVFDLKSEKFLNAQDQLNDCLSNIGIVVE